MATKAHPHGAPCSARSAPQLPRPGLVSRQLKTFRRGVVWLTWDAAARFDLLLRNGALEGSLRAPLGRCYALVMSSARDLRNVRVLSAGIARSR